jgi:DeoR/GlpR family transcriptional regulator of sugar metabolism
MLIIQRHERLIEILRDRKSAQLEDLAKQLSVSASTVRRDLETLEDQGLVERTHGGAVFRGEASQAHSEVLAERMKEQVEPKQAIGRLAASLVQPQMTILLDGGSTVVYAARQIIARPLQIVTTSLPIANAFADDDQVELVLVGGSLYPRTGVTIGPIATGTLADLHADLLLFSLAGVFNDECFNSNLAMAQVEQVMMQQAAQSVLLMDSSKFGRKSLARVCSISEVDRVITNADAGGEWADRLGERLMVAEPVAGA